MILVSVSRGLLAAFYFIAVEQLLAHVGQAVGEGLLHANVERVLAHDVARLVRQYHAAEAA